MVALVMLTACASMPVHEQTQEIRISGTALGASIELTPPALQIEPGQRVVWINHTNYDLQINFDPGHFAGEHPSFIPAFSSARGLFDEEGTYSYTLVYSAPKTFGRVTGTIVVGNPRPKEGPRPGPPAERPPRERLPEIFPDMI